ncbi:MAG: acyltransferase [Pseudomonadota bacterium]
MTKALSLYLDVLRLLGALMVLLAHWAFPRFTGEDHLWMRRHDLGGDGVVLFFVLSGLLIAYAAERRRQEGPILFATDRLSRLWSVALPMLALGFVLDTIGPLFAAETYAAFDIEPGLSPIGLLTGVTFTNQLWFADVPIGSNAPYWSLGYEAWYYIIFAAFFFGSPRWRWFWAGAACVVAGPKIMLLAPSWVMGVLVWRLIASGRLSALSRPLALTAALFPVILYVIAHRAFWHLELKQQTGLWLGADWIDALGASDTFVWAAVLGVLVSVHILGVAALAQSKSTLPGWAEWSEGTVRWLAGGSYALYLVHYPVLFFAAAMLPGSDEASWRQALLLAIPILVSYGFAELTERRRPALRGWMRRLIQRKRRSQLSPTAPV